MHGGIHQPVATFQVCTVLETSIIQEQYIRTALQNNDRVLISGKHTDTGSCETYNHRLIFTVRVKPQLNDAYALYI